MCHSRCMSNVRMGRGGRIVYGKVSLCPMCVWGVYGVCMGCVWGVYGVWSICRACASLHGCTPVVHVNRQENAAWRALRARVDVHRMHACVARRVRMHALQHNGQAQTPLSSSCASVALLLAPPCLYQPPATARRRTRASSWRSTRPSLLSTERACAIIDRLCRLSSPEGSEIAATLNALHRHATSTGGSAG